MTAHFLISLLLWISAWQVSGFIFCAQPVPEIIVKALFSADCVVLCQAVHHCEERAAGREEQTYRGAVSGLQVHFSGINS